MNGRDIAVIVKMFTDQDIYRFKISQYYNMRGKLCYRVEYEKGTLCLETKTRENDFENHTRDKLAYHLSQNS